MPKIWWKKSSGLRKNQIFSFFTYRAQWVTMQSYTWYIVTRDPHLYLWISPVLWWIFQCSWVHLKAVRVPNMTAKSQVNSFYSSQGILNPRIAGSRLIKHSLITFDLSWEKILQANIEANIEKQTFGSPSRIVISFPNQLWWLFYQSNFRIYIHVYVRMHICLSAPVHTWISE